MFIDISFSNQPHSGPDSNQNGFNSPKNWDRTSQAYNIKTIKQERNKSLWSGESSVIADRLSTPHQLNENKSPKGIVDAYLNTCNRWRLNKNEQIILLGLPEIGIVSQQFLSGKILTWSTDIKDRIGYVVGISLSLGSMLGEDIEAEFRWLSCPRAQLCNLSPLQYMLEGRIINLITVAELVQIERGI